MNDGVDLVSDLESGEFDSSTANGHDVGGVPAQPHAPDGTQHINQPLKDADAPAAPNAPEPTLRDQITSAFKDENGDPTDQAHSTSANETPQAAPPLSLGADGKYHNIDGTFASTDQIAAFEASQAAAPEAQPDGGDKPYDVTSKMTPLEQTQFNALTPELQQYVARTTEALDTRASQYQEYDLLEQIVGPRRQALLQNGTTLPVALNELFALSDFAGKSPSDFVMWFSQQHGIDLDALLDEQEAKLASVDPNTSALQQQVQQLTDTVTQLTSGQQQQSVDNNVNVVKQFATEADANGALLRPHFAELGDNILPFITATRASNPNLTGKEVLAKAYESACWADPSIRGKMQEQVTQAKQAELRTKAAKAKTAGSSISGGPVADVSGEPNNPNRSLRDELRAQFAAAEA